MAHNSDMGDALTLFDGVAGIAVLFAGIVGVYWQLVRRVDAEKAARESLGKDLIHVAEDVAKLSITQEKLVRREHRREGAAMARSEPSGVQDVPTTRMHVGTDTTL